MFDLPKYGDGVCLARLAELLDALAVDRARLQRISVVVTGSNGKGSTAAFCAGIARACGLRTGLFTSPHLFRVNERFQVDGAPIGDDDLARLASRIEAAIAEVSQRSGEKFGAFEAMFALACLHFQETAMRVRGVRGRHRRPLRSGAAGRRAPDLRHLGRLRACRAARQLAGIDRFRQERRLCSRRHDRLRRELPKSCEPHLLEYNRHRDIKSVFVRDQIAIVRRIRLDVGAAVRFRVRGFRISIARNAAARRVSVQQCRYRGRPVPAVAGARAARERPCSDRIRGEIGPPRRHAGPAASR